MIILGILEISTIAEIFFVILSAIIGTILTYIFVIPVLQNKIQVLEEENKSRKTIENRMGNDINLLATKIAILEKSLEKIYYSINELNENDKRTTEKFEIMIHKNTEAITKLEITLQHLTEHTKKLDSVFEKIFNYGKGNNHDK
jgi:hypothetical protein